MKLTPIKTRLVKPSEISLIQLLDESINSFSDKSVLAITSKVVSLCEGRVADGDLDKEELIAKESDLYLDESYGRYGFHFTVTRNTLISMAGIDQSNGNGQYVFWPKNPQSTANLVRKYLIERFHIQSAGVIITDSTCMPPMRSGTVGVLLAHSGFSALNNQIGKPDLFGRPFHFSKAGVGSGLAAAANLVMGEGEERTPLIIMEDLSMVEFQDHDPTKEELDQYYIPFQDDLYLPFIGSAPWIKGEGGATRVQNEARADET